MLLLLCLRDAERDLRRLRRWISTPMLPATVPDVPPPRFVGAKRERAEDAVGGGERESKVAAVAAEIVSFDAFVEPDPLDPGDTQVFPAPVPFCGGAGVSPAGFATAAAVDQAVAAAHFTHLGTCAYGNCTGFVDAQGVHHAGLLPIARRLRKLVQAATGERKGGWLNRNPGASVTVLDVVEAGLQAALPVSIDGVAFNIGDFDAAPGRCGVGMLAGLLVLAAAGQFAVAQAVAAAMRTAGQPSSDKPKIAAIPWGFLQSFLQLKVRYSCSPLAPLATWSARAWTDDARRSGRRRAARFERCSSSTCCAARPAAHRPRPSWRRTSS